MQLPQHLSNTQPCGLLPGECIGQFEIGRYKNFVYLILDWETKNAAIIDPQSNLSEIYTSLKSHKFHLTSLLVTHTHFDHVAGVPEILEKYPTLKLRVHAEDASRLNKSGIHPSRIQHIENEEIISVGNLKLQALHTPGHSAGEVCYLLKTTPPYLFSGDTLFIRDCGRTDLETGSNEQMFESLQKIKALPPNTVILPGHHYQPECASTLALEIKTSPPLRTTSVAELAALP